MNSTLEIISDFLARLSPGNHRQGPLRVMYSSRSERVKECLVGWVEALRNPPDAAREMVGCAKPSPTLRRKIHRLSA